MGPGPDGLRADLLKMLMGDEEDEGILLLYRDFVQLLADGLAPLHLRPWLGGGQLIGIGKVDPQGNPIPLDQDARPIVMGVTWRKVVFKCTLASDKIGIRDRLLPSQLAVGVSCGAVLTLWSTPPGIGWRAGGTMIPLFCCKRTFEMPLMNSSPGNFCGMLSATPLLRLGLLPTVMVNPPT